MIARAALLAVVALLVGVPPAHAELVFFSTGRVMSVKAHRATGDEIVLLPRDGGEIAVRAALVARIEPDEVPYPEPPAPSEALVDNADEQAFGPIAPAQYDRIIERVSAEQRVDPKLVRAVIQVESNYQERARSSRGAMGLMQLMPDTARQYAVTDPYDPAANIEAGIKHLRSLLDRYPLRLALAAYNAGAAAVDRFRGIPPYPETRDYVSRILQLVSR
jgi:soluble lytic murein transglycosylase-like protein